MGDCGSMAGRPTRRRKTSFVTHTRRGAAQQSRQAAKRLRGPRDHLTTRQRVKELRRKTFKKHIVNDLEQVWTAIGIKVTCPLNRRLDENIFALGILAEKMRKISHKGKRGKSPVFLRGSGKRRCGSGMAVSYQSRNRHRGVNYQRVRNRGLVPSTLRASIVVDGFQIGQSVCCTIKIKLQHRIAIDGVSFDAHTSKRMRGEWGGPQKSYEFVCTLKRRIVLTRGQERPRDRRSGKLKPRKDIIDNELSG